MNCPRCKTPVGPLSAPDSIVTCPGCGSRLMTRSAALRSQGGSKEGAPAPPPPAPSLAAHPPSATLSPTPGVQVGAKTAPASPPNPPDASRPPAGRKAPASPPNPPDAGHPPAGRKAPVEAEAEAGDGVTLAALLREVRAVRETQRRILDVLEGLRQAGPAPDALPPAVAEFDDPEVAGAVAAGLAPIRAHPRKTVVLVDDDPQTREAAVAELQHADVPVRAFDDGNAALASIAEEKPDAIVLELGTGGDMRGKDLVNFVKATMEWVDIPIILWTREPVASQREARQIHGADEWVPKSGGTAALLARLITVFRHA